jgi:hypothetical protein
MKNMGVDLSRLNCIDSADPEGALSSAHEGAAAQGFAAQLGEAPTATSPLEQASASNKQNRAEKKFNAWNDRLTADYVKRSPDPNDPRAKYVLYRAAKEHPKDVFKKGGKLEIPPGTQTDPFERGGRTDTTMAKDFSLERHVTDTSRGTGTAYISTTRDLQVASNFAAAHGRSHVYVMDPLPQGRDVNAVKSGWAERDVPTATSNPGPSMVPVQYYIDEQEVSVPGTIPTHSIRGAIPVKTERAGGTDSATLNYEKLIRNDWYKKI